MKKTCPECGADNPENFKYCTQCGHELPKSETNIAETLQNEPGKRTAPADIPGKANFTPPPRIKDSKRGRSRLWIVLGCVAVFLIAIVVGGTIVFKKIMNSDRVMVVLAQQVNAKAPMMVDNATRFDSAVVLQGNSFQYNYTAINFEKGQLDTEKAKRVLEPGMINAIKTSDAVDLQYFRNHKTTVNYVYKDKMGQYMFTIVVTPDKYQ